MNRKNRALFICTVLVVAFAWVSTVEATRTAVGLQEEGVPLRLFRRQLETKLQEMAGGPRPEAVRPEPAQRQAILFVSEGFSACIGSVCIGSGCTASACGGSGCGGSACAGSACPGSVCGGSACGGSVCIGSACGVSACGGSACGASGCGGSLCGQSGCGGSLCGQSACAGSLCNNCPPASAAADQNASLFCPLSGRGTGGPGRIVGLDVKTTPQGARVSWIATGFDAERFRIYRLSAELADGPTVLIAEGKALPDRLLEVPVGQAPQDARYRVEVLDATGRAVSGPWVQALAFSLSS